MTTIEIRPLQKTDDRKSFTCGNDELDRFFIFYARQNQQRDVSVTYVTLNETSTILGFCTITAGIITCDELPDDLSKKLPDYPLPIVRLARLGVSVDAQGLGIGALLLKHTLHLAIEQSEHVGCIGVVVDAKPEALSYYQKFGFRTLQGVEQGALYSDEFSPMFLSIKAIKAAQKHSNP